jgi:hypothetical protein
MLSFETHRPIAAALAAVAAVAAALAGCGKPPPTGSVTVFPPACEVLPAPLSVSDTITVALFERVAPEFAPWGHNAAEDIVFRHVYETLITLDCVGRAGGGLASSWKSEDDGYRWVFGLRDGARFSDGSTVTAGDVVESWSDALMLDTGIDSAEARGDRTVVVHFREPSRDVPLVLSAPPFSVARKAAGARWPLGSGPYRVVSENGAPVENGWFGGPGRTIILAPARRARAPVIRFVAASTEDARDLLESPIDLMVTEDPTVIEYASGDPRFVAAPLEWERTYTLLSTARVRAVSSGELPPALPSDFLGVLSRDAVRAAARGSRPPRWWESDRACRVFDRALDARGAVTRADRPAGSRRVVYDADDPTARDLAERIVALAAADTARSREATVLAAAVPGLVGGSPAVVARGVGGRELDRSLRAGDELAYIVSFHSRPALPCDELARFFERVPWVAVLGSDFSPALLPLIDTRTAAIARKDRLGMFRDWYGRVFVTAGEEEGE